VSAGWRPGGCTAIPAMRTSHFRLVAAAALSLSFLIGATQRAEAVPQKVVVFLAMPGAGKSTLAHALANKTAGAPVWSSGDVIRNAVAEKFGVYTIENDKAMRQEFGKTPGKIGALVAAEVAKVNGPLGIVEGFRTPEDLAEFKRLIPNVEIVAIQVGAARRYDRMLERGRAGETSEQVLRERDASEVKLGVRRAMQLATVRIRPGDGPGAIDHSIALLMKKLSLAPSPAPVSVQQQQQ
jgi:dephospho-CoA kinase